jgi:hypothetical protein
VTRGHCPTVLQQRRRHWSHVERDGNLLLEVWTPFGPCRVVDDSSSGSERVHWREAGDSHQAQGLQGICVLHREQVVQLQDGGGAVLKTFRVRGKAKVPILL